MSLTNSKFVLLAKHRYNFHFGCSYKPPGTGLASYTLTFSSLFRSLSTSSRRSRSSDRIGSRFSDDREEATQSPGLVSWFECSDEDLALAEWPCRLERARAPELLSLVTELHSEPSSLAPNFGPAPPAPTPPPPLLDVRLQPPGKVALPWWIRSSSIESFSPVPIGPRKTKEQDLECWKKKFMQVGAYQNG